MSESSDFPGYHDCQEISVGLYGRLFKALRDGDNTPTILKAPKSWPPTKEEKTP